MDLVEICASRSVEACFDVLYVGSSPTRLEKVCALVEQNAEIRHRVQVADGSRIAAAIQERKILTANFAECLLVVADVQLGSDRPLEWLTTLKRIVSVLQRVVVCVTDKPSPITLREQIALTSAGVLAVAEPGDLEETIRRWCGPGQGFEHGPDLRFSLEKRPEDWLSELRHHYILNTVKTYPAVRTSEAQVDANCEIDLFQSVLRDILITPWRVAASRGKGQSALEQEIYRRNAIFRIVAPQTLRATLDVDFEEGTQYAVYDDAAAEPPGQALEPGEFVLVQDAKTADLPHHAARTESDPLVLVADSAPRATWQVWQQLRRANVVGVYTYDELRRTEDEEKRNDGESSSPLSEKREHWRACAHVPLPRMFDRLVEAFVRNYESVPDTPENEELREKIFRALAMACCARTLYLG